ncbi:P-loop containing nucleoside triphosphate hydrolase protein [Mycena albidolilacea]|uniref:P-loop containing nucleoside triphosphate hydrolase protein n=1 Tax=Mycena albidolilacea TaxID=1033008 RepID=A0AAD6YZ43_9AGAR|nr:P-loop containing nucleoside triphosphate hydrolase protein [Mycena albidolilacea]
MRAPTRGFPPVFFVVFLLISHNCLAFKFYSAPGFKLAREILLEVLPHFDPHHYQIDGICKVLDGIDLVAVTQTGSGKTAYLFLSILVMIAISKSPALCPAVKFPKDAAIVVVCPTNSIEQQMDENMAKLGVVAVTINSETAAAARLRGEDLWIKARAGISMLILDLLAFEAFYDRVCALGVDEIHLLVSWGQSFRKAFQQIGFMRARLRPGIPIIGLTASLLADPKVQNAIFATLGVNRGEFHLIRRSNARHDIQFLFRRLHSGIDGRVFPEIAWVLNNRDKTLIFGTSISLVHRLKSYLNGLLAVDSDRDFRIRTHTGLDWPDDKAQTLTDITDARKAGSSVPRMSRATAEILTAECKPTEQDRQFDNPPLDSRCPCKACTESPPAPQPELCRCSGCMPETASHELYVPPLKKKKAASDIPQGKRLTKIMKEVGRTRLEEFRLSVWMEAPDHSTGLTPLAEFLPDIIISQLLDRFANIEALSELSPFISRLTGMEGYHGALFEVLVGLREKFKKMKKSGTKK